MKNDLYNQIADTMEQLFNDLATDENGRLSETRRNVFRRAWQLYLDSVGTTEDEFFTEVWRRLEND
jgi:hypothetical protein